MHMRSKAMRPRASLYKAYILIAVVPMLLAASSLLLAQVSSPPQESPTALDKLAKQKFGPPTPTEERVIETTARGEVAWGNHSDQPDADAAANAAFNKSSNDPANAAEDDWRDNRRVRAGLIRWLCEDGKGPRAGGPTRHRYRRRLDRRSCRSLLCTHRCSRHSVEMPYPRWHQTDFGRTLRP